MDILGVAMEGQEDEVLEDAIDIQPYVAQARSFSRLRMDSHRVS